MKKILKILLDHSTEIIVGAFILAAILGMGKLLIQRIDDQFYSKVFYVYACPQNSSGSKCYKTRADYVPGKWINQGNDYEPEYFETIYFENGGYISFSSCDIKDKTYTCFPEKESDGVWNLQISEVVKVKK